MDLELKQKLIKTALLLSIITVLYNIIEGIISVYFGYNDETLALFGFGIDSFVEVISGIGIWHMILRFKNNSNVSIDKFEKTALKITGTVFYILSLTLIFSSFYNIYYKVHPETTFKGIVIAIISICVMWWLIIKKKEVGLAMNSQAIIADANCTKTCMHLSIILMLSSLLYHYLGIGTFDSIGSLLIGIISYREGREAFYKSQSNNSCC